MNLNTNRDMWQHLAESNKKIVMYGMGNGADKILRVCEAKGIEVCDFFASDGFVRGHSFHGKKVLSYSEAKEKYGAENMIVLLSFASSLESVIDTILRVASECELYAPDVPVFGDTLFDLNFIRERIDKAKEVYSLLEDGESREIFENVIAYKLTGDISYLEARVSDKKEVYVELLRAEDIRRYADLGAYNGDTVRELAEYSPRLESAVCFEPDRRNFKKLSAYAETEKRFSVTPVNAAAWSEDTSLLFDAGGNRNSNVTEGAKKTVQVGAKRLDGVLYGGVDYIKYDVEGAEREALIGSQKTILAHRPRLLISAYHRNEDIFALPLQIHEMRPDYSLFLRRYPYIPAWDLNLICL